MKQSEKDQDKGTAEVGFEPDGLETSGCLVPLLPPLAVHHLKLRPERKRLVFNTADRRRKKQPSTDR